MSLDPNPRSDCAHDRMVSTKVEKNRISRIFGALALGIAYAISQATFSSTYMP